MDETGERKRMLRGRMKERLAGIPEERILSGSARITAAVLSSRLFRDAGSVFIYVSVGREPDTREIIRQALKAGKKVYVPKCGKPPRMEAVRIFGPEELRPGRMGIPEPGDGERAEDVDLAIVPCVSVSRDGRRLGHGGGYYDAFLRGKGMKTLCLCHEEMLCEDIPVCAEDEAVEWIAAPELFRAGKI